MVRLIRSASAKREALGYLDVVVLSTGFVVDEAVGGALDRLTGAIAIIAVLLRRGFSVTNAVTRN